MPAKGVATEKTAREADQLEQACAVLSDEQTDRVWDTYVAKGYGSAMGLAIGLKAAGSQAATDAATVELPAELADALEAALSTYDENDVTTAVLAALDALGNTTLRRPATLTDSGKMSAQKSYNPTTDPYAIAAGADQAQPGHRMKAADGANAWAPDHEVRLPSAGVTGQAAQIAALDAQIPALFGSDQARRTG